MQNKQATMTTDPEVVRKICPVCGVVYASLAGLPVARDRHGDWVDTGGLCANCHTAAEAGP